MPLSVDQDAPIPKKRRPTRRPLSCTECKRRKTKCSSLGVIPCEACVKRGYPNDCRWDEPQPSEPQAVPMTSLAMELESLRKQLEALQSVHAAPPPLVDRLVAQHPAEATMSILEKFTDPHDLHSGHGHGERTVKDDKLAAGSSSRGPLQSPSSQTSSAQGHFPNQSAFPQYVAAPLMDIRNLLSRDSRKELLMTAVFSVLPSDVELVRMVETYLSGPYHRGWHIVHSSTFRSEVIAFVTQPHTERQRLTDPAWVAVLLMTLAYALYPAESPTTPEDGDWSTPEQRVRTYFEASRLALDASNWDAIPQIRHVQVCLLYVPHLYHFGATVQDINTAIMHVSAAITTVQALGIDRLNSDRSNVPLGDRAFTHTCPELAYHLCQRLFHWVNFLDGTFAKRDGCWRFSTLPTEITTKLPLNLNDEDFIGTANPLARSPLEVTDSTIPQAASVFASLLRSWLTGLQEKGIMDYASILKVDLEMRMTALKRLPSPLQAHPGGGGFNFMQCALFCSIHNRLMRIHRPFLLNRDRHPEYEASRLASVDSASQIVAVERIYMQYAQLRPTFHKRWILGAIIILVVDVIIALQASSSEGEIDSRRQGIVSGLEIFQQEQPQDRTPGMTFKCRRTVEELLLALDRARQRPANRIPSIDEFFKDVAASLRGPAGEKSCSPKATPETKLFSTGPGDAPSDLEAESSANYAALSFGPGFDFDVEMDGLGLFSQQPEIEYDWLGIVGVEDLVEGGNYPF